MTWPVMTGSNWKSGRARTWTHIPCISWSSASRPSSHPISPLFPEALSKLGRLKYCCCTQHPWRTWASLENLNCEVTYGCSSNHFSPSSEIAWSRWRLGPITKLVFPPWSLGIGEIVMLCKARGLNAHFFCFWVVSWGVTEKVFYLFK